jgi:hypothetical protein
LPLSQTVLLFTIALDPTPHKRERCSLGLTPRPCGSFDHATYAISVFKQRNNNSVLHSERIVGNFHEKAGKINVRFGASLPKFAIAESPRFHPHSRSIPPESWINVAKSASHHLSQNATISR